MLNNTRLEEQKLAEIEKAAAIAEATATKALAIKEEEEAAAFKKMRELELRDIQIAEANKEAARKIAYEAEQKLAKIEEIAREEAAAKKAKAEQQRKDQEYKDQQLFLEKTGEAKKLEAQKARDAAKEG